MLRSHFYFKFSFFVEKGGIKKQLKDKVAIITGGNGVLGHAFVKAYLKEGAKVVIAGRSPMKPEVAKELDEIGGEYLEVQCDVSNSAQVKEMFEKNRRKIWHSRYFD